MKVAATGGVSATNSEEKAQVQHTLNLADSLMEENPDTAYTLLKRDSALVQKAGKAERMRYALLKTNAEDKLYIPHKSDSLMREVADYYEKHGSEREQVQAYYLLGRVYHDMYLYGSAVVTFKKALEVKDVKDSVLYRHKARAANWLGGIYEQQGDDRAALKYNEIAYSFAKKSQAVAIIVYCLRDIGRSYDNLGYKKLSEKYYEWAVQLATVHHDPYLCDLVLEELAFIYLNRGDMMKADNALNRLSGHIFDIDKTMHYALRGRFYEKKGNIEGQFKTSVGILLLTKNGTYPIQ